MANEGSCLRSAIWLGNTGDELIENKVKFNYRGNEHVGDVIVNSENENNAINDAMYLIDKALGRVCFAHNIEPSMSENASYVTDLSKRYEYGEDTKRITCSVELGKREYSDHILQY